MTEREGLSSPQDPVDLDEIIRRVDHADEAVDKAFLNSAKLGFVLNAGAIPAVVALFSFARLQTNYVDAIILALGIFLLGIVMSVRVSCAELTVQEKRARVLWRHYKQSGGTEDIGLSDDERRHAARRRKRLCRRLRVRLRRAAWFRWCTRFLRRGWRALMCPDAGPYNRRNLRRYWRKQKRGLAWNYGAFLVGVILSTAVFLMNYLAPPGPAQAERWATLRALAWVSDFHWGATEAPCEDPAVNLPVLEVRLMEEAFWVVPGPGFVPGREGEFRSAHLWRSLSESQLVRLLGQVRRDAKGPCRPYITLRGSAAGGSDAWLDHFRGAFDLHAADIPLSLVRRAPRSPSDLAPIP